MLCPVWVKKLVKATKYVDVLDINGKTTREPQVVKEEQIKICGCKSEVLLRVHYKKLDQWREREGKFTDDFALCAEHGEKYTALFRWKTKGHRVAGSVAGLRGTVERVEVLPLEGRDLVAQAREDKNQRKIASIKSGIKRTMCQSNTRGLTPDHWRQAFNEALDEWIVETTMLS